MADSRTGRFARRLLAVFPPALAAAALLAVAVPAAVAQETPQMTVAVLGVQEVAHQATAGQAVQAEVRKREEALKAELERRENALLAADQQLAQQRASLSQEEFVRKRNELGQQLSELRKYQQEQKAAISAMIHKGEAQIEAALNEVVEEVATARNITLVLDKAQVVRFPSQIDITKEVLDELNARLPSVNLTN